MSDRNTLFLDTASGRRIAMLHPTPDDICLADIARGLAYTCRFGGQVRSRYASVAEHSVRVASILADQGASQDVVRIGLLHDAAAAYIGDVILPVKNALRVITAGAAVGMPVDIAKDLSLPSAFDWLEKRWLGAIGEHFGLGDTLAELPTQVKDADVRAFELEREHQYGRSTPTSKWCDRVLDLLPEAAEAAFLGAAFMYRLRGAPDLFEFAAHANRGNANG